MSGIDTSVARIIGCDASVLDITIMRMQGIQPPSPPSEALRFWQYPPVEKPTNPKNLYQSDNDRALTLRRLLFACPGENLFQAAERFAAEYREKDELYSAYCAEL